VGISEKPKCANLFSANPVMFRIAQRRFVVLLLYKVLTVLIGHNISDCFEHSEHASPLKKVQMKFRDPTRC
jgi:hypothetical protein